MFVDEDHTGVPATTYHAQLIPYGCCWCNDPWTSVSAVIVFIYMNIPHYIIIMHNGKMLFLGSTMAASERFVASL